MAVRSVLAALSFLLLLTMSGFPSAAEPVGPIPEQQIWSAPLGPGPQPEIDPAAAASGSNAGLVGLPGWCANPTIREAAIADACRQAALALIQSQTERQLADDRYAIAERERLAALAERNQEHALAVFAAQAWQAELLFWLAMAVVVLGILAAAVQFRLSWRDQGGEQTEITVSQSQVTIRTAWIGVVLLAMSMGFLALYLTLVFQIEAI